ncbi:cysteine-rich receptor-like protein kinase 2 [Coffea arabica]|uniref:Cysteine-rich receptor-like protein kinase 2 n=1 Tax=Coffea arabica TaxID=13443 RepID=A0A6P6TC01_COFAR|nr:cysteine-rich receptor-like protein kinase 2 [Coffea arabica]
MRLALTISFFPFLNSTPSHHQLGNHGKLILKSADCKKISTTMGTTFWNLGVLIIVIVASILKPVISDPQTNLLNRGCSQYNATNFRDFHNNRNATFNDLRNQLSLQNKHFATAQQSRSPDPVYAMVQCRNYLSTADCVSCFDAAVAKAVKCKDANGGRVVYDGCFLRYESNTFYDQSTLPGNVEICSTQTGSRENEFGAQAQALLKDLQLATPRITGYFAASKREVSPGGRTVYGVAQCAETISQSGCEDCLTVAFNNIQGCLPNADGRAVDVACFLRYSETSFFPDNQTIDITPFLRGRGLSKKKVIIIGVAAAGGGLLIIIALAFILWCRLHRKPEAPQKGNIFGATELQGPVAYDFKVLKTATRDFSKECKLGGGGFGEVFKGTLNNGNIVAVKKLKATASRPKEEVESEIRVIGNVHHRNLIRLLGCSTKGAELLLVYEYMANGSLDKFLYGDKRGYLNWKQRFDIVFGTARCLAYLHEQYHFSLIHRDVKSSNILLDNYFQPKISDFGMAALMPEDRSHLSSFSGNLGYIAPEYAIHGQLSEKVDVYSFGVVVLETISGRSSNYKTVEPGRDNLLEQAWKQYESDMHLAFVDETLDPNDCKTDDVKKLLEIALLCTQSQPSRRPTMSEVVVMLSSDRSWAQQRPLRTTVI